MGNKKKRGGVKGYKSAKLHWKNVMEVYKFNINELKNSDIEKEMLEVIDYKRRETLGRIKNRKVYLHSLVGEWMIRQKTTEKTGLDSKRLVIERNEYGKPYFLNFPEIHFNISHSGNWVLGILSNRKCGIDVEQMKETHMDIARRFFANDEYQMLLQEKGEKQRRLFYELWTLKESYVKYEGTGMTLPFHQFCVERNESGWRLKKELVDKCQFYEVEVAAGYIAYACISEKGLFRF